jgi:hypothetical protein
VLLRCFVFLPEPLATLEAFLADFVAFAMKAVRCDRRVAGGDPRENTGAVLRPGVLRLARRATDRIDRNQTER